MPSYKQQMMLIFPVNTDMTRNARSGSFPIALHLIFETGSSSEPGASYVGQTDQQISGICVPFSSPALEVLAPVSFFNFYVGGGIPISGIKASSINTLPIFTEQEYLFLF